MLIRSQNREAITDNITIWIDRSSIGYRVKNKNVFLGYYSTKEKAIKVLDMIQDVYINETRVSCNADGFGVAYNQNSVFQMPKDKEVEEND